MNPIIYKRTKAEYKLWHHVPDSAIRFGQDNEPVFSDRIDIETWNYLESKIREGVNDETGDRL